MTEAQREKEWHLDRKVTLALILALLANAGATVWFAAQLDQRVTTIENRQEQWASSPERITKVETQIEGVREGIKRIESKLDRIIESR
jgi:cyclopropane fatty-acyl-phospholipid synthase-like methyltransferase